MDLTTEDRGGKCLVKVDANRIDAAVAIQFKDKMREVADGTDLAVVLDMSSIDFIDSSGLGAVVAAMKHLGSQRKLEIAGVTPTVAKVFRLTRMDTVMTIHPDLDAAFSSTAEAS